MGLSSHGNASVRSGTLDVTASDSVELMGRFQLMVCLPAVIWSAGSIQGVQTAQKLQGATGQMIQDKTASANSSAGSGSEQLRLQLAPPGEQPRSTL